MNDARNAVNRCRRDAFRDVRKQASARVQCAMLTHLADICRWSCELRAMLNKEDAPKNCDHHDCAWMCYETEAETADALVTDESTVRRVRLALIQEKWVACEKTSTGRGAVWFFWINRARLIEHAREKDDSRRVKMPTFFDTLACGTVQADAEKVGTVPTLEGGKGRQGADLSDPENGKGRHGAHERCSPCTEKVGTVPEEGRHGAQNSDRYKEERIEHIEHQQQSPVEGGRMSPEMLAKQVQFETRISGWEILPIITEQCRFAQLEEADDEIVDSMVTAWRDLTTAMAEQKLRHSWGAAKFFGEGHWKNKAAWTWKDGHGPTTTRQDAPKLSALEEVQKLQAEALAKKAKEDAEYAKTAATA